MKNQKKPEEWKIHCVSKDNLPKTPEAWDRFLMHKKFALNAYEQDIEDNFEKHISSKKKVKFIENVVKHRVNKGGNNNE